MCFWECFCSYLEFIPFSGPFYLMIYASLYRLSFPSVLFFFSKRESFFLIFSYFLATHLNNTARMRTRGIGGIFSVSGILPLMPCSYRNFGVIRTLKQRGSTREIFLRAPLKENIILHYG